VGVVQRQGIKNTIIIYIGILIGFISLLIIQPTYLTKSEQGLTRLLLAFSSLFSSVFSVSISTVTIRFFPQFKNPEKNHHGYFGFMLLFPLIGTLLGCLILYLFKDYIVTYYSKESKVFTEYFYYTFLFSFFLTVTLALNGYCGGILKTTAPSFLSDVFVRIVFIGLILAYHFDYLTFHQFIIGFIFSYGFSTLLLLAYIYKYDNPGLKIDWEHVHKVGLKVIFKYGAILTITAITSVSLKFLDMIMIGHFKTEADVGVYSIAAFIATIIETPLNSLERIAHTKISHSFAANNFQEIKDIYFKSSRYLLIFGGLLTVLVVTNIHDLLLLVPNDYTAGINVTIVLSLSAFINMATGVNYPIIFNSSRYYWGSVFVFIMLSAAVILNIVLIPVYGIIGAAIATAISSVLYNLMKFFFIWIHFNMQPFDKKTILILLLLSIAYGVNFLIPDLDNLYLNVLIHGLVTTAMYLTGVYGLKIVPEFHKHIPLIGKKQK
jgi:O-antigen/teichoic acid export membrane protein